jgi:hypothetical protein
MDKKLLESFQNLSLALEQLSKTLEESKKDTKPTESSIVDALKSLSITEQLKSIDEGVKKIKDDNKEIIKNQKSLLAAVSKQQTQKPSEYEQMSKTVDRKQQNRIKDGVKMILMIAGGILAIGLAFKLIGGVNLKTVLAISLALPLIAFAFEKVSKVKTTLKDMAIANLGLVMMAVSIVAVSRILQLVVPLSASKLFTAILLSAAFVGMSISIAKIGPKIKDIDTKNLWKLPLVFIAASAAITFSSYILQYVKPVGFFQLLTTIFIASAFAILSFSIHKLADGVKNVDVKNIWKLPIVLVAASVAIAASSFILQTVKPVGIGQLFTTVFIAAAFAVISFGLGKIVKALKDIEEPEKMALLMPLILFGVSAAIAGSSRLLALVQPISFSQALTSVMIAATFVVISYGLPKLADAISKVSVGKALLMPIILVALSAAIYGSSLILSKVQTIPFMTLLNIAAQAVVLSVISVAMGTVIFIFDKMKITLSKAIEGGLSLIAISGAIMASSLLLSMGNYSNAPTLSWTLDSAVSILAFGVLAAVGGELLPEIILGSLAILAIAGTIMLSSKILAAGEYGIYPDFKWSFGVGLSLLTFGILMSALGLEVMTGVGALALLAGAASILAIAGTIVGTAAILNQGSFTNYPPLSWSIGVGLSLLTFGLAMGAIGLISLTGVGALALLAGAASILAIAGTIVGTAAILNQGSFTNYPPLSWAIGVGLSLLEFGTAMAISGPLFPLLWIGSKAIPMIANSIVETAAILSTGKFTGGPSLPWAIGTGILMTSFGTAMLALGAFIGGTLGAGYLALKAGASAIKLVAQSIVDAAAILATGVYTGGPTESWAKGVGLAISAFAPVYASLSGEGILGIFSGGGPSAKDMANAIRTISQGIVDAALFFSSNSVAFEGGPSKDWADGVGGAISAFAPVINNLNKGGIFGLFTGGLSTEDMTNSIVGISSAIVASAQIFAGVNFTGGPTEEWSDGISKAITTFAPLIDNLNKGGIFGLFKGGLSTDDMTSAIIGISIAITESSLILAKGNYTPIPMDFINSLSSNVKEVVKLTQYLNGVNLDGGDETFLGIRIGSSQISRMANDYQKLSNSISNLSTAIQSLDVDRLAALKTFTGSIVLMSLMDSAQFEDMMNSLEAKAKVFVDVINDLDKGVGGSELSIKTAGAAQQGPSLQDVVVVLNRMDAKLSQISSSNDNISRYVNEIRTPKAHIKKK